MMQSTELDLGPLTWVKGEIDQALARALACVGEAQTSGEQSTQLQFAQTHVHQTCGALAIVGLDAVAQFATSLERLLSAMSRDEQTIEKSEAFSVANRAIAAIGNYLEDLASTGQDQPLRLSRLFCEIENARGVELANPAKLFTAALVNKPDLPLSDIHDTRRRSNAARRARVQFESGLLQWLKNPADPVGAVSMAKASGLACALQDNQSAASFWLAAQAFLQALSDGALTPTGVVRRVCTQLGRELRRFAAEESAAPSEHLLRDLLYWVSQAPATTEQQRQVVHAWQLDRLAPAPDSQVKESPLAPLIKDLLHDIGAAKEEWDRFSEGLAAALPVFQEKLAAALVHSNELGRATLTELFDAVAALATTLRRDPASFDKDTGMEVASALLLAEMLLDKSMPDKEFRRQANNAITRLQALGRGEPLQAGGALPANDAAKRLGEHQAKMQVAREILSSLAHVEQTLDDFFRDQSKQAPLRELSGPLRQIQGALSLLDDARATELVEQATSTIETLAEAESPDPSLFEPLAHQLSALGMYVDALQHGATRIQRFLGGEDSTEQENTDVLPAAETPLAEQSEAQPAEPVAPPPPAVELTSADQPAVEADEGIDAELLEIFIEEAGDVLSTINTELPQLRDGSDSPDTLTTIRRGFHTLKGSGRMVGLIELSDAAKEVEQTLNLWLQLEREPTDRLIRLIEDAVILFDAWAQQISDGGSHSLCADSLIHAAQQLRQLEAEAQGQAPDSSANAASRGDTQIQSPPEAENKPAPADALHREDSELPSEEDVEVVDYSDFELDDFDPETLDIESKQTLEASNAPGSVKIDESFMSTVIQLDNQIFGNDEDPTLQITALDSQPFDFGEYDAPPDDTPEHDLNLDLPRDTDLPVPEAPDSADQAQAQEDAELDIDIDLNSLDTAGPSSLDFHSDSLDGPEAEPFDFGDLSLDLDLSDEEGELQPDSLEDTGASDEASSTEPLAGPAGQTGNDAQPAIMPAIRPELEASDLSAEATETTGTSETAQSDATSPQAPTGQAEEPLAPEQTASRPDVLKIGDVEVSSGLFDLFTIEAAQHLALLGTECEAFRSNPDRVPSEAAHRAAHTLAGISATTHIPAMHTLARALEHAMHRLWEREVAPDSSEQIWLQQSVDILSSMLAETESLALPKADPGLEAQLERVGHTFDVTDRLTHDSTDVASAVPPELAPESSPAPLGAEPDSQPLIAETQVSDLTEDDDARLPAGGSDDASSSKAADSTIASETDAKVSIETEPVMAPELADQAPLTAQPSPVHSPQQELTATQGEDAASQLKDELDPQLLGIFREEGQDLLSQLSGSLRQWRSEPGNQDVGTACARLLHTLKGSARMAGALRLGEQVHQIESWLQSSLQKGTDTTTLCDELEASLDQAAQQLTALGTPAQQDASADEQAVMADQPAATGEAQDAIAAGLAMLRIRADKVDSFVNQAGEIGIARTRIEGELRTLRGSLLDLTENVIRLRNQLREVELQAETQMQSRMAQAESAQSEFDPLEMDRFTRLQELTRMMAESVGDVTTVQQTLLRNLDGAEIALHSQARQSRELQQSLMQVRMVPFDSIANRLHRIVRQSAKDMAKRANLDLRGGRIEMDRGVLETMVAPLEHLLRNAIAHGIESPEQRQLAGKSPIGQITLSLRQEGNEIGITLSDDGAGLNLDRIAERARDQGLLSAEELQDQRKLANMIFVPGFTTAASLSTVSGRGIGMDVVKADTASVGGRVEVSSQPGAGTSFRINLPLTLAATQALLVRAAGTRHAIPSNLIAQVMEIKAEVLERVIQDGGVMWQDTFYPYSYLPWLIDENAARPEPSRLVWLLLLRSGDNTLALHVDSLQGNQEIVVKNAGPQLMRIVGISGVTLLADGEIVLIINPIALSRRPQATPGDVPSANADSTPAQAAVIAKVPTVMVVDDSLTVRKIAGRLLEREGYRVISAKDGVDALEHLIEELPDVILSDIEMPRMDGFDLLRNIRADERTVNTPVIMITSRLADKHRDYAMSLGASHYLGKPYDEDELLGLIAGMTGRTH